MSIGSVNADDYNCNLFEPIGYDPIFMHLDDFQPAIHADQYSNPNTVSPGFLSNIWKIDNKKASKVLDHNIHLKLQVADNDPSCQLSTNICMLCYWRINRQFFTDTFFDTTEGKYIVGNNCAQIFVNVKGFVSIQTTRINGNFQNDINMLCKYISVYISLFFDPSEEKISKQVRKFYHQVETYLWLLEESNQWYNRAELYIGLLNQLISDIFQLNGNTMTVNNFGVQGDISNICHFYWYDSCYFYEEGKLQSPI